MKKQKILSSFSGYNYELFEYSVQSLFLFMKVIMVHLKNAESGLKFVLYIFYNKGLGQHQSIIVTTK